MAELKGLKIKRGQLKGQVKRFGNFIEAEIEDEQEITVRLERLTAVWESFQNIQYAIRDMRKRGIVDAEGRETQLERIELEEGEEEAAFEDSYFRFVATAKRKIAQVNQVNHVEAGAGAGVMAVFKTSVKLPTITLPTFNGQYSQWIPFKDAFISLIDKNTALSEIQKLQYLRGTLKNEALNFIEGLETTAENYRIAWQLLENHYENRRLIINTHLKELFETAPMMKGNRTAIRQFVNHIRMHIKALTTLKLPVDQWDAILIYLATNKLDYYTRKEWETHISTRGVNELPRMEELLEFLTSRYHMLEMVEREKSTTESRKPGEKRHDRAVALAATANNECEYCKGTHRIFNCDKLLKLPVASRSKEIKQLKLCLNCLRKGHWSKECRASGCKICKAKHNSLLHLEPEREKEGCAESSQDKASNVISTHCIKDSQQVLLSTAKVYVFDRKGQQHICRVLLDPGSQSNLITRALVDKLHLACKSVTVPVSGINQSKIHVSQSVVLEMQSRHSKEKYELECLVLGKITERIPQNRVDIAALKIPSHFTLADEDFHNPGTIDVLIGAGIFWQIIKDEHEDLLPGQLRMQSTSLGWILGGYLLNPQKGSQTICNMMTNDELSQQLELFWQAEEGSEQKYYSPEEQKCEEHFQGAVQRNAEGRFIVGLPQREDIILADSYTVALKRWHALEGRFERQPEIKQEYIKFMEINKELEHMSLVEEDKPRVHSDIYYMPHHPVIKNSALTSKLRVVFDASAQSESGVSLNHKLLVGPVLQGTLIDMLLKFRIHQYVLTADLEMMYRQILVREQDRDLQRILWRTNRDEDIQIYRLNTLIYGTASAPFLAVRCLKELAMQEGHQYPTAAEVLQKDFYMDDLITGTYTLKEACYLQQELTELLQRGKFRLRKWRSNDKRILHSLEQEKEADEFLVLNKHETLRTLGLLWNSEQDSLQYEIQINGAQAVTKRQVLSLISKIFDPLGIIGPVLIIAKKLMQQLWKEQLEWDQELPYHLHERWKSYYESLNSVKMLSVPRNVNPDNSSRSIDLHIFCDASEKAYGACVYIKGRKQNGQESIHLMCSRSRVAPLKSITLPRLELNAAHLAAKLYYNLERVLSNQIGIVNFWTDATIVLNWISTSPHKLKTYVANRVADIQRITQGKNWYHVPSNSNPADLLSRGITAEELKDNKLWWHGPPWLAKPKEWPLQKNYITNEIPELKKEIVLAATANTCNIVNKFSSLLKRVMAYCVRFIQFRKKGQKGAITAQELEQAMVMIVRLVQQEAFKGEIEALQDKRELHRKSKLLPLRPFLDEFGLLRVGGRLRHADISSDQRHPWILPAKHHVTTLIFREEHKRLLHCGPEQLLSLVRLRYWPLAGRHEARKVTRNCMECFQIKPKPLEAVMADLPKNRLQGFKRPFTITGVDYAGPIQIRESKRRGRIPIAKGYIAIFVCFSTKAVHLEAVTDLTTETFLAALRRFTARRGLCTTLYSDNATNFIGAARELKEIYQFLQLKEETIKTKLAQQGINWKFIPPRSPNFGGLWEAAVKAAKRHLYTVTRNLIWTYEEFSTLLAEIESVLNSRPLTPLSSHPDDLIALSPAHFLIGDSPSEPVQKTWLDVPTNTLSRWQHQQKIRQHFWTRWQQEYLHQLQKRTKWYYDASKLEVGTMVLVMDEQNPPLKWSLGRILEIHRGDDQVARVASVKTINGVYKRNIRKLCALPMDDSGEKEIKVQEV